MRILDRLFARFGQSPVQAATQPKGPGTLITTSAQLEAVMRGDSLSASGAVVNANSAMRVAAVYACVRIIAGAVATLPLQIKRRLDDKRRENAADTQLWAVFHRRPNRWQTVSAFKRMMQAHVLLRGNAYARIVKTYRGDVQELIPLHPDRVKVTQLPSLELHYEYTRADGSKQPFKQEEILHLYCLTLDGITGVTPITYARESIGLALAMEDHGGKTFRNGARVSGVFEVEDELSDEAYERFKAGVEEFRAGAAREGQDLILEAGMKYNKMSMTAADAQWIESRKFTRTDIAMFFGVPPHLIGDTEKSTSWGTGLEQQTQGFVTFALEDHLTMWEDAVNFSCIPANDEALYARFERNALVRGDIKSRYGSYAQARQWGIMNADEIRAKEDMNPREDGRGGEYAEPPNTSGSQAAAETPDDDDEEDSDEPSRAA